MVMKINSGHKITAVFAALLMILSILVLPTGTALADGETPVLSALSVKYGEIELIEYSTGQNIYNINVAKSVDSIDISATAQTETQR
jgi:hypothetical protein